MLYAVSRKWHCFGLLYLQHSSTNFSNFCRQYWCANVISSPSDFCVTTLTSKANRITTVYAKDMCLLENVSGSKRSRLCCAVRWLWKELVDYSKCSKWQPLAFQHACSHIFCCSVSSSTTHCGILTHVSMRCCFKSFVSQTDVLYTCSCIQPQIQ